ncbi:hypothetical protein NECAME_04151 [Necator americanus]|uniref:Uncharacterized protein n=1 Tax=Necator americanus TaxID=51031 RepID=W2SZI0_NECAM|nr:hypothetical protein NECAME_04151 [Necator americanus]ETN74122.1 hypothetical protein NECAME_04151 [Necator americanus]
MPERSTNDFVFIELLEFLLFPSVENVRPAERSYLEIESQQKRAEKLRIKTKQKANKKEGKKFDRLRLVY